MWHHTHFDTIPGIFALNYCAVFVTIFPITLWDIISQAVGLFFFFSEFILRINRIPEKNFAYLKYAASSKYLTYSQGKTLQLNHP